MDKKDAFIFITLVIVIVAGCYIGHFTGGIIVGVGAAFLILATIGKRLANKAAARINKTTRDYIVKND